MAAEEIVAKPIETIWDGRIQLYDLNAFVGREKVGKGLLLKRLAADLTTGKLTDRAERVLYLSPEESVDAQKVYLVAAGADLKRVDMVTAGALALPFGPQCPPRFAHARPRFRGSPLPPLPLMPCALHRPCSSREVSMVHRPLSLREYSTQA